MAEAPEITWPREGPLEGALSIPQAIGLPSPTQVLDAFQLMLQDPGGLRIRSPGW